MALRVPRQDSVRPGIADACQSCKMATMSNKLYFMFRLILRFRIIEYNYRLRRQHISIMRYQQNNSVIIVIQALYHCVFPAKNFRNRHAAPLPGKVSRMNPLTLTVLSMFRQMEARPPVGHSNSCTLYECFRHTIDRTKHCQIG